MSGLDPEDGGRPATILPPLLDRDAETALLRAAVDDAVAGTGRLVVIEGPAGIGKSRLLQQAAELARSRVPTILHGAGDELRRTRALGLVRGLRDDAGAPAFPDLDAGDPAADVAAPDGGAAAVHGVLGALRALTGPDGRDPVLLVLDDLHWADAGSLRVLDELAGGLATLPLAVVVATRPREPGAFHDLLDRLRARAGAGYVRPAPLSASAVGVMAAEALPSGRATPQAIRALAQRSGGNPFYVRELLRADAVDAGDAAVPDAVRRSVRLHLQRLGPEAVALARAVSVLGSGRTLRTAAALAGLDAEAAEAAADALARVDVLRPGDPLAFEHALLADAVRAELEPFARARLHRRAATLLHEHGAADDQVAAHLLEARADGDPWVAATLLRAARATNAAGDPVAAGRLLERARREPPPPELEGDVAGALAEADALAGRPGAAERLAEALQLIDDPRRRAELRYALSRAFHLAQRFGDAARTSGDALDGLAPDDALYDRVLAGWMTDALFDPHLQPQTDPRVAAVTAEIRAGSAAAGPLLAHATTLAALDEAPADVVRQLARRATSRDPLADAAAHGFPLTHVSTGLLHADLLDELLAITERALASPAARTSVLAQMTARGGRAYAHLLRGELTDAVREGERAQAISRATDTPYSAWWIVAVAEAHLAAGDVDAAQAALRQAADVTIPAFAELRLGEAAAAVALQSGDPEAAIRIASAGEEARAGHGGIRLSLGARDGRGTLATALAAVGRRDEALELADAEVARTADAVVPRHHADALLIAGAIRGAEGTPALEQGVALLRSSPSRVLLLRALTALGLARRAAGDAPGSRAALLEALELAERLGLSQRADELRGDLRTVGARPRRAALRGPGALTDAELDVARLAASGLGNPAIAARRHVSRKTVETHLGRIYRKLGIGSRDELAAALADGDGP
ncbi:AAA family ATPase [Patulibacter sp. NPDC049589]|uniref:ATP-binding protein n=1 Tax=Patulibacter sp. NPDC049589 TaxID=3154731 RepID=UPI003442B2A6